MYTFYYCECKEKMCENIVKGCYLTSRELKWEIFMGYNKKRQAH